MAKKKSSAAPLGVVGLFLLCLAWGLATEHPIFAVIVLFVVVGAVIRQIDVVHERGKASAADQESMIRGATAIVNEHATELTIRRKQLTATLNYGVVDDSKWRQDIEFFIDEVIESAGCNIRNFPSRVEAVRLAINEATHGFATSRLCFAPDMDPTDYESMVADALSDLGWQTRLTKGSGDQGIDVIAEKCHKRVVIQCKRYGSAIGNAAVQEAFAGKSFEGAGYAAVVSNAPFTRSAKQLAASTNVILLHHDELSELETKVFSADAVLPSSG